MRILICGGSGLLGRDLCKLLSNKNINYLATYNNNKIENGVKIDIINDFEKLVLSYEPNICINCIVERQVDKCETDWINTKYVNIDIPNHISAICNKYSILFIHISTDYVFDGFHAPYSPDSIVNPLQNYGISKLIAEQRIRSNCYKYTIIRVPVLYTDNIQNYNETAITLIGKKVLNQFESTKEDNYSIRRPVYIPDLCLYILGIINNFANNIVKAKEMGRNGLYQSYDNLYGIYHFYNEYDKNTKYEIAKMIGDYLHKTINHIIPNNNPDNTRPYDTQLVGYIPIPQMNEMKTTRLKDGIEKCFNKIYHPPLSQKNCFILLDFDGTLVNTDDLHYECYRQVLYEYNITLDYNDFLKIINESSIDIYLNNLFDYYTFNIIKNKKHELFKVRLETYPLKLIDGLNIDMISEMNYTIVSNSSITTIELIKNKLPQLKKLKNWITRENYINPKPNSECYQLALSKYYNNEPYIIGFENTINGYNSLKSITNRIYILPDKYNYNYMKNLDIYLIKDYTNIFN
jgi:dTDP-4-dehydrorhamnose reductase